MPGMGILESLGRGVSHLGSRKGSLLAIGAVAGLAGFAKKVGPAARDAVLDVGLGDPNADRYFTGSKFSGRSLLGAGIGGNLGNAIQMTSPGDYMRTHPMIPGSPGAAAGGAVTGGAIGALAGGVMGAKKGIGGMIGGALAGGLVGTGVGGLTQVGGVTGSARGGTILGGAIGGAIGYAKSGFGGMLKGGIAGAGIGTIAGLALPAAATMHYMKSDNPDFFSNSPYSQKGTRQMMNDLGAAGDIVLGMHNSRRGY